MYTFVLLRHIFHFETSRCLSFSGLQLSVEGLLVPIHCRHCQASIHFNCTNANIYITTKVYINFQNPFVKCILIIFDNNFLRAVRFWLIFSCSSCFSQIFAACNVGLRLPPLFLYGCVGTFLIAGEASNEVDEAGTSSISSFFR